MTSSSLRLSRPNHDNPVIANEHSPASFYECLQRGKEWTLNRAILMLTQGPLLAQSDRLAKAPYSGHPDAGRIYHATVRLSLETDLPFRYFQS
jgi:hypothetical protein